MRINKLQGKLLQAQLLKVSHNDEQIIASENRISKPTSLSSCEKDDCSEQFSTSFFGGKVTTFWRKAFSVDYRP